jgi:hypothetical protein
MKIAGFFYFFQICGQRKFSNVEEKKIVLDGKTCLVEHEDDSS